MDIATRANGEGECESAVRSRCHQNHTRETKLMDIPNVRLNCAFRPSIATINCHWNLVMRMQWPGKGDGRSECAIRIHQTQKPIMKNVTGDRTVRSGPIFAIMIGHWDFVI